MKIIKPLIIIILSLFSCSISSTQKTSYEKTITDYQAELNAYYFNSIKPLKRSENIKFSGIDFFPIQEKYRVKANFIYTPNGEIVKFPTSDKKTQTYKKYGIVNFQIDKQALSLTLYQFYPVNNKNKHSLFLPFTDETSGDTTYGGGRYLNINSKEINKETNTIFIDFNKAYNPLCAYSTNFSCPIPPADNFLPIEINAGANYSIL